MASMLNTVEGDNVKELNLNKYATKKTIAQGIIDLALLTTNVSQLKYLLDVGERLDNYVLLLIFVILSMIFQAVQGIIYIILGSSYDLNKTHHHVSANMWNNICLTISVIVTVLNIVVSGFDMREAETLRGCNTTR